MLSEPFPAFHFYIALIEDSDSALAKVSAAADFLLGGFSECTGLESELQMEEYAAGGENDRVYKFPSRAAYPNIILTRGVGFSESLYLWHEDFLKGEGIRRNGLIFLANETRVPIKTWKFEGGIPIKWTGPSLNAGSSALAIEKLEIAHERLELVLSPGKLLDSALGALGA